MRRRDDHPLERPAMMPSSAATSYITADAAEHLASLPTAQ
jgi:hypothetical protein